MSENITAIDGGPVDQKPGPEHNVEARKKILQECGEQVTAIKKARAELNEQMGDIRERLRDNDFNVRAFMEAHRLAEMEDATARDSYLDALRETYSALPRGGQLDAFPASA